MANKTKVFVPGGLQKSIPLGGSSAQGTIIAGFQGQILSIAQLKTLLGLSNPNTVSSPGQSTGSTAALVLGQGLSGGGPLLGTVRVNPISPGMSLALTDGEDGEQSIIPGPPGLRGLIGPMGPPGSVFLLQDEQDIPYDVVPGPRGLPGATGPTGPTGPAGSAGTGAMVWLPYDDAVDSDPALIGLPLIGPQNILLGANYTWPGTQVFTGAIAATTAASYMSPGNLAGPATGYPGFEQFAFGAPANNRMWQCYVDETAGSWNLRASNDNQTQQSYPITITIGSGTSSVAPTINLMTLLAAELQLKFGTGAAYLFDMDSAQSGATLSGAMSGGSVNIAAKNTSNTAGSSALLLASVAGSSASGGPATVYDVSGVIDWYSGINTSSNNYVIGVGVFPGTNDIFRVTGGPALAGKGPVAGAFVDMTPDASTFTGTFTGMNSSITGTCVWSRQGNQVLLFIPSGTGTSNSTSFTMTGLPTAIQPARSQLVPAPYASITDNTGGLLNEYDAQVSGSTVTFWRNGSATGWTAAGTKGVNTGFTITYLLN